METLIKRYNVEGDNVHNIKIRVGKFAVFSGDMSKVDGVGRSTLLVMDNSEMQMFCQKIHNYYPDCIDSSISELVGFSRTVYLIFEKEGLCVKAVSTMEDTDVNWFKLSMEDAIDLADATQQHYLERLIGGE